MNSEPIKILLVEDNPGDARLIREMLTEVQNTSSHCECADRLSTGLERLAEGGIDVVLLDLSLPDSHGLNTLERVHAHAPEVPIVVMTGFDNEMLGVKAVKEGAQDYLVKGQVDSYLLMHAIRYAIERQRVQIALRESEERYALAVGGANDGLWDWKLETNVIYLSPRWKFLLGYGENEIGNSPEEWFNRIHPEELEQVKADIAAHLEGHIPHFENEHRMKHKDGTYRWMLSRGLAVRGADGKAYRMAGSQTEITDRKMAEEKLFYDASHDALTGLPNRSLFMDLLSRSIGHAKRHEDYLFAVLFLDLDRFKVINDSLGHQIGDQLLIEISKSVEKTLRPNDTMARLGGDEFAILLDDLENASHATRVAGRIQKRLSIPFNLSGHQVYTTASIGIALSTTGYDRAKDFLRDADTAMYRAKAHGKARHEIFDMDMHTQAVALLQLEEDLRRALDHYEFQIHYQPILSLVSGKITGVEALVRWQHPQRGLLFPVEFIPLAEKIGLIQAIDEWVLRTACAQNKAWNDAFNSQLQVAVNFSSHQFQDPNLLESILGILKETGMTAEALELEITESIAMKNTDKTTARLNELNAIGIQISIDDFGTGYSSLGSLKRFPIKTLKIDESFIRDMTNDSDDAAITAAIIAMAHQLKMQVIAEGVETEEQLAFLRSQQCDKIQGYLFSRPVPAEAFTKQLQEGVQNCEHWNHDSNSPT